MTITGVKAQVIRAEKAAIASSNVTCYIVTPIGIMKIRDMNFGNIVSGNAGAIVLSPEGYISDVSGNVALETSGSSFSSASFEVSDGIVNNPGTKHLFSGYSITLPTSDVILKNENGKTMRVSNFTSSTSGFGNFKNGVGELSIGATLYVSAEQGLGRYASSAPFPVTVNFY